ncbi:DEAD/DEAH box helicase [Desulforhopalus singaporensis]|uniref:Superfamily II DNA or RNA helicase n=1 Tax=Desulforhopalus singaporensis TaxID=91360 RepID=A0A1H0M3B9_9BACT|nr:DEAD/DEAH box helicase [Desulforhopalus singaporensis]SDO74670.1 Superfamily II DNA or RNA helicase [Desulforhopalus singaporensis]
MATKPILTVSSDCAFTGIAFDLEQEIKNKLTLENPQYTAAKKYGRWIGKNLKRQLRYYDSIPGGLRFPRGFANQAVLCCRRLCGFDPEIVDNRRLLAAEEFTLSATLRPYQQDAVGAAAGKSFGVIEAGTGSGKTVMALALIARRKQPTLVVVHTKELLYQWQERIREFLGCEAGLVGDGRFEIRPVTVAIVNSARKRVEELAPCFGHLVVDECHRVPASLFTDVVSVFDCHFLLGLSATAFRSDGEMTKLIYYFMGDRIHRVERDELMATGAILSPEIIRRGTSFSYRYRGDYQALIKALVGHEGRNRQILDDIIAEAAQKESKTILVVSDRISHCRFFVDRLKAGNISCELLSGQLSAEMRNEVVARVLSGDIEVLVATLQLIGEGFDCPGLTTLFLTTPIRFEGRLLQVIGRIMRPAENKRAKVYDYIDENIPALLRSANDRGVILSQL